MSIYCAVVSEEIVSNIGGGVLMGSGRELTNRAEPHTLRLLVLIGTSSIAALWFLSWIAASVTQADAWGVWRELQQAGVISEHELNRYQEALGKGSDWTVAPNRMLRSLSRWNNIVCTIVSALIAVQTLVSCCVISRIRRSSVRDDCCACRNPHPGP